MPTRRSEHHLTVPVQVDRDDLLTGPVGEPEPAVVPARRLAEDDPGHQGAQVRHGSSSRTGIPVGRHSYEMYEGRRPVFDIRETREGSQQVLTITRTKIMYAVRVEAVRRGELSA